MKMDQNIKDGLRVEAFFTQSVYKRYTGDKYGIYMHVKLAEFRKPGKGDLFYAWIRYERDKQCFTIQSGSQRQCRFKDFDTIDEAIAFLERNNYVELKAAFSRDTEDFYV